MKIMSKMLLKLKKIERQCCFYCFVFVKFSIYLSVMDSQELFVKDQIDENNKTSLRLKLIEPSCSLLNL